MIPAPVGAAVAVSTTAPLTDGFQVQFAENDEPEPVANLFLHPEIITFFALKVTFAATVTFAVIVTTVRYEGAPLTENELKEEVSTTSVTVMEIDCWLVLPAVSVALIVKL